MALILDKLDALKLSSTRRDLARLLGFKPKSLAYILYLKPEETKYKTFELPKKSGGVRKIKAPEAELKKLQSRLSDLLQDCISDINRRNNREEKLSHGFRRKRSTVTNAYQHRARRYVLNLDLSDFFGSINFGRVRGYFLKNRNFALSDETSTTIAQIACDQNSLPQGAPSSPVISNLIAHVLDIRLAELARKFGCHYTRYADDLTFSTNKTHFPIELAYVNLFGRWTAGAQLKKAIKRCGFEINKEKTRMQFQQSRQDVTGLIVNKKVNVKPEYYRLARARATSLFRTGSFHIAFLETQEDGQQVAKNKNGTINQLGGMFSFIDSVKKYVPAASSNKQAPEHEKPKKKSKKAEAKSPTSFEKLYRNVLLYRHFLANEMPMIVCEGKTDNVYLRCGIRSLAAKNPTLSKVTKKKEPALKVRLFNYTEVANRILGLSGGAMQLKNLIELYKKTVDKCLTAYQPKHPVIILVDNDDEAKKIYSYATEITGAKPPIDGKKNFYFLFHNLYLVPLPLIGKKKTSVIEDFIPTVWTKTVLNGKTFVPKNSGFDPKTQYGKSYFAEHVVKRNRDKIDFGKMQGILDRITLAIEDFATRVP